MDELEPELETLLTPLNKLQGAEPSSGIKTKPDLQVASKRKASKSKGIIIDETN